jgi:hypothetical protein
VEEHPGWHDWVFLAIFNPDRDCVHSDLMVHSWLKGKVCV